MNEQLNISREALSKASESLQDREWSGQMEAVKSTYPTGYADGVGDLTREVIRLSEETAGPSIEKQLLEALQRLAADRHVDLEFGPLSDLVIPLRDEKELRLPMIFLTTVPDVEGVS